MLISAGFGMLPAAMWTRNSGPTASGRARVDFSPLSRRDKPVEPLRVAQFLHQQRVKIVGRELPEKIVQSLLQALRARKAGFRRAASSRAPACERGCPACSQRFRHVAQHSDQLCVERCARYCARLRFSVWHASVIIAGDSVASGGRSARK